MFGQPIGAYLLITWLRCAYNKKTNENGQSDPVTLKKIEYCSHKATNHKTSMSGFLDCILYLVSWLSWSSYSGNKEFSMNSLMQQNEDSKATYCRRSFHQMRCNFVLLLVYWMVFYFFFCIFLLYFFQNHWNPTMRFHYLSRYMQIETK